MHHIQAAEIKTHNSESSFVVVFFIYMMIKFSGGSRPSVFIKSFKILNQHFETWFPPMWPSSIGSYWVTHNRAPQPVTAGFSHFGL